MSTPLRLLSRRAPAVRLAPAAAQQQTRPISWFNWGKKKTGDEPSPAVPDSSTRSITDLLKRSPRAADNTPVAPVRGALADSSILGAEVAPTAATEIDLDANRLLRDPARANWGWLKTAAARDMRRRGRLTRQERILQTEKEHTAKSHFFKTSMKKLAPLARQIAGKSVADAIIQMRFSPKKAARDVLAHLHHTHNEAVVRKGMKSEEMYIAQAWVNRGPFEKGLNHRARGRIDMLMLPYQSITLVLKEHKTLERIAKEKAEKAARRPVRQHLPSRPIYGQRQYYSW